MSEHVYRVTEIVGSSADSVDDAIRNGARRAAKTLTVGSRFAMARALKGGLAVMEFGEHVGNAIDHAAHGELIHGIGVEGAFRTHQLHLGMHVHCGRQVRHQQLTEAPVLRRKIARTCRAADAPLGKEASPFVQIHPHIVGSVHG